MPTKHNQTKAAPATQGDTQKTVSIVWAYPTSPDAARFGFKESGCWIVGIQSPGEVAKSISGHADKEGAQTAAKATGLPFNNHSMPEGTPTTPHDLIANLAAASRALHLAKLEVTKAFGRVFDFATLADFDQEEHPEPARVLSAIGGKAEL